MTNSSNAGYRRRILAGKGLTLADLHEAHSRVKTPMMKWIEFREGKPIEELLDGTLEECAKRLGTNKTTISKWKMRLGLPKRFESSVKS